MLDLLSPSIRPDGDVAAKTTPAVTRTVAQRPNQSVVVFTVVKVFTLSLSFASRVFLFLSFWFLVLVIIREIIQARCQSDSFRWPRHRSLCNRKLRYFAVATGLPFHP